MLRIKICGTTNLEDALVCVEAGAHALGFIFAESERKIEPAKAKAIIERLPPWIATVGVFANASVNEISELKDFCRFEWAQLHGNESPEVAQAFQPFVIKTIFSPEEAHDDYPCNAFLLDQKKSSPALSEEDFFRMAAQVKTNKPLILAGKLTPENLNKIKNLNLYGVDVARGVEASPGKKDPKKVRQFIHIAKTYKS